MVYIVQPHATIVIPPASELHHEELRINMERAGRIIGKLKISGVVNDPRSLGPRGMERAGWKENRGVYARYLAGARYAAW